ncbi:MAG: Hsp20/alpha crystallin family protein [Pseudomonadota bacterium]
MVEKSHTSGFWPALYDPFRAVGQRLAEWVAPAAEASGSGDTYQITIELPGVSEEDIHIAVANHTVTVQGEKRTVHEKQGESYYFSERAYGSFSRSFRLPPDADGDAVAANLTDGVLTISIPKHAPAPDKSAHRVPISRG